jgi:hypothetical protein
MMPHFPVSRIAYRTVEFHALALSRFRDELPGKRV